MRLTFVAKETQTGNSPTLWDTDEDQWQRAIPYAEYTA